MKRIYKKNFSPFKSLRVALLFIILLTSLLPLLIIGLIFYKISENSAIKSTLNQLNVVTDAERDDINGYLTYLIAHIRNFQNDPVLLEKIKLLEKNSNQPYSSNYVSYRNQINSILKPFQTERLTNIFLLTNNKVIYSTNNDYQWHYLGRLLNSIYEITIPNNVDKITFSDIYQNNVREDEFDILMIAPLESSNSKTINQIAFEIPLSSFYQFLDTAPTLGYSTESLLLTKDENRLISTPRFNTNLAFKVSMNLDSKDLKDYRKQPVFAVEKSIDYLPWILLTKIDVDELHHKVNRIQHYTLLYIVIISLILAAILVVVASYLSRTITQPIKELANAAKNINHTESNLKLDTKLLTYDNEIGLLANSLAKMSEKLNRYYNYLKQARFKAQEESQLKSRFLANMSHELRSPLNAVIGYSEMLADEFKDAGLNQYLPDIDKIAISGKHLISLINDVLDISKIEAGKMELLITDFALKPFLSDIAIMAKPLVEKNNNHFIVECIDNIGSMHTDMIKLKQSLLNLISNACKFTEKGKITLRVRSLEINKKPWIQFEVEDSGIGISSDNLDKLFRAFSQVSGSQHYGGTGLGLYLSLQFSRIIGGNITVKSKTGQGSTFTLLVPAVYQPQSPQPTPAKS